MFSDSFEKQAGKKPPNSISDPILSKFIENWEKRLRGTSKAKPSKLYKEPKRVRYIVRTDHLGKKYYAGYLADDGKKHMYARKAGRWNPLRPKTRKATK